MHPDWNRRYPYLTADMILWEWACLKTRKDTKQFHFPSGFWTWSHNMVPRFVWESSPRGISRARWMRAQHDRFGGGFKLFYSTLVGEMIQFHEHMQHMFQMGWFNHHLVRYPTTIPNLSGIFFFHPCSPPMVWDFIAWNDNMKDIQQIFQVLVQGGMQYIITQLAVIYRLYTSYSPCLLGGLYNPYHLIPEPE